MKYLTPPSRTQQCPQCLRERGATGSVTPIVVDELLSVHLIIIITAITTSSRATDSTTRPGTSCAECALGPLIPRRMWTCRVNMVVPSKMIINRVHSKAVVKVELALFFKELTLINLKLAKLGLKSTYSLHHIVGRVENRGRS